MRLRSIKRTAKYIYIYDFYKTKLIRLRESGCMIKKIVNHCAYVFPIHNKFLKTVHRNITNIVKWLYNLVGGESGTTVLAGLAFRLLKNTSLEFTSCPTSLKTSRTISKSFL